MVRAVAAVAEHESEVIAGLRQGSRDTEVVGEPVSSAIE